MLRPDGPFVSVPALTAAFPQYLDKVPGDVHDKLRLAWAEVQESPDTLTPSWCELVLTDLLGYNAQVLAEGAGLPGDLTSGAGLRPDAVASGPDGSGGLIERLLIYRRPFDEQLTKATKQQQSPAEQAAILCRTRGVPLALLTNGAHWVLVHARPGEAATTVVFDADYWPDVPVLLRAFYSLLRAPFLTAGGLARLFSASAAAQAEVTTTLGDQVADAVELLIGEASRLDRESGGTLLASVEPHRVYRGALTVMMRLVFMLYAEERDLLPMADSELYREFYSVTTLHDQLQKQRDLYGDEVTGRFSAGWQRLLAAFAAVYGGCEHDQLRLPAYGGGLFDPARYPWLEKIAVSDLVTAEMLRALLILHHDRKAGTAERLSYKGLDVEQIGHVYEGLLEFGCERAQEPYLALAGKHRRRVPLAEVEVARSRDDFAAWIAAESGLTPNQVRTALEKPRTDRAILDAACDNDHELSQRVWPFQGLLRPDLRGRPTVLNEGALFVTHDGDRRATGTHYTPRPLAEKIVRYTLEPLCYTTDPETGERKVRPAEELLKLKILDPAMGSGAFLVSACRYLAERLVEAWARNQYPKRVTDVLGTEFDREDALREAARWVASRCLYGVDRDEAAVELGKLSLWIATLSKGKPFSFLDHALRWGDSLVGLTSAEQVKAFHLDPAAGRNLHGDLFTNVLDVIEPKIARILEIRMAIEDEPAHHADEAAKKAEALKEADALIAELRPSGDAVAAAALSTAEERPGRFDQRLSDLASEVKDILLDETMESPAERAFAERLRPWLKGDRKEPIRPFHWALEFPEVMAKGGFDAVVSNPPFIGGQYLGDRIGIDMREYLVRHIAGDTRSSADLCAYFLLRDLNIAQEGRVGVIATNTIAQGGTYKVGLDRATSTAPDLNWTIYRADKSQKWPGAAKLEVSLLWLGHPAPGEQCFLDDVPVDGITPSLNPRSRVTGNPFSLDANKEKSFLGSIVLGTGFILEPAEAKEMIRKDKKNEDVIRLYLNGEDLNTEPDSKATRSVINFGAMSDLEAADYQRPWEHVVKEVRPSRIQNKRKARKERWWQFAERAVKLYNSIAELDRVLVIARLSKTGFPQFVPTGQVFSDQVVVFPTDQTSDLALLSSSMHFSWWTTKGESTLENRLRYTPSKGFETFPQPTHTDRMTAAGATLDSERPSIMKHRVQGLTKLYNDVHDETNREADIERIREIHVEIDEAVREAYALDEEREPEIAEFEARIAAEPLPTWREIDLAHGFHVTPQGVRYTISPQARTDILDKLLALNHYRHRQEQTTSGGGRLKPRGTRRLPPPENQEALF